MKKFTPNNVSKIIRTKLTKALEKDFCGYPFRIFCERDLHACCYFHLRRFLRGDREWEILNEPLLRGLKGKGRSAQPDIVLFRKDIPVLIIELKFRRSLTGVQKKDRTVLQKAVEEKKRAKKAFYIEAVIQPKRKTNRTLTPYRNKKISILMRDDRIKEYKEVYKEKRKPKPLH